MNKREYSKAELGMMYGVVIGAAVGVILYLVTGTAVWFAAAGFGVAIGHGIGTSTDGSED